MKKLNLTKLLILCCLSLSCNSKTEKKQPPVYNNNQNYKFDDDEIIKKSTKASKDKKHPLEKVRDKK